MDYDQEYTETPSKFPNMFAASSFEQMHQPTIDMLLDEILDIQIFSKYFDYHYWMWYIMPVCKKWKSICERSRMPKQITIRRGCTNPNIIQVISKHQPDTIQIDWFINQQTKLSIYSLLRLIRASKRCTTLVISEPILATSARPLETQKITQITKLCLLEDDLHCIEFFPNVKHLQICNPLKRKLEQTMIPSNVKYLSIDERLLNGRISTTYGSRAFVFDSVAKEKRLQAARSDLKNTSYDHYYRFNSFTKMAHLVTNQKFEEARKLLQTSETTFQREMELSGDRRIYRHQNNDSLTTYDYEWTYRPCRVRDFKKCVFDLEKFYETEIARDFYEQLNTCCIEVKLDVKLNLIARFGSTKEAIAAIKRVTNEKLTTNATFALFKLIVRDDVRQILLKTRLYRTFLKSVLGTRGRLVFQYCKETQTMDKLAEFIDWTKFHPRYTPRSILPNIFVHGVRISIRNGRAVKYNHVEFCESLLKFLKGSDDWSILDEIIAANYSLLDALLKSVYTSDKIKPLMTFNIYTRIIKRYKYDVNKIAVKALNHFQTNYVAFLKEFTFDWKKAVEIANESPFHSISYAFDNERLINLLQNGVDPKIIPANTETIICFIVNSHHLHAYKPMNAIDVLLAFGLDINEPSYDKITGQKHTPLTMAMLTKKPQLIIDFLKSRGALTDEEVMME